MLEVHMSMHKENESFPLFHYSANQYWERSDTLYPAYCVYVCVEGGDNIQSYILPFLRCAWTIQKFGSL